MPACPQCGSENCAKHAQPTPATPQAPAPTSAGASASPGDIAVYNAQVASIKLLDAQVSDLKRALALREKELNSNGLLQENARLKEELEKYDRLRKALTEFWEVALQQEVTGKQASAATIEHLMDILDEHWSPESIARMKAMMEAHPPTKKKPAAKKAAPKRKR